MCNCSQNSVGDIFTDAIDAAKKFGGNAANEVANQVSEPVKEACRQGAIVAIKDYSIPVTAGIAAVLTTFTVIGFVLGKHYKNSKK